MAIGTTAALIGLGVASAGAGVASAKMQSGAAKDAAATQSAAANRAAELQLQATRETNALQKEIYDQNREDFAPWRTAGTDALGQLTELTAPDSEFMKDFAFTDEDLKADPSYQFRLTEGQKALERSAAARGTAVGGAALKALTRYGQDFASTEYDSAYKRAFNTFQANRANRFNTLASLAGVGQQATSQMADSGEKYAANVAQNTQQGVNAAGQMQMGAANATAAGQVGSANAWSQALGGGVNSAQNLYLLSLLAKP